MILPIKTMNFLELDKEEILTIGNPMMDNLMAASTEINHKQHVKDFTKRLRNIVTEEWLKHVCEDYQTTKGFFTKRTVIDVLRREDSAAIIWKQHYSIAKGEFLAEMIIVKEGDRYLVDHVAVY